MLHTLTDANFSEVTTQEGYIFVDFGASWCPPCKAMLPIVHSYAEDAEFSHVRFYQVDADAEVGLLEKFAVSSLPTFYVIKLKGDGTCESSDTVQKFVGAQDGIAFRKQILALTK